MMTGGAFSKRHASKRFDLIATVSTPLGINLARSMLHAEKFTATGKLLFAISVPQETVVADALEACRQDVDQKASDKFVGAQRHHLGFATVAIVLPMEADISIFDVDQAIVGDGDAVGIASDIVQNPFGPGKGGLCVNDPVNLANGVQIAAKRAGLVKAFQGREELQLASPEGLLQRFEEQATEQPTEDEDRQKESRTA